MFDYSFVDLDDTLYDTRQLKEDIYAVFKPLGIGHEDFIRAYRRAAELPRLGYFNYTFEKQIEAVRGVGVEVPEDTMEKLNKLLGHNYMVPGAVQFLTFIKTICAEVILLTAGTYDFQAKKIEAVHLAPMFDEIKQIEGGKDLVLAPFVSAGKNILFVNDNLDENIMIKNKFNGVAVLTLFNPSYWTTQDCEKSGLPWFKNLGDMQKYLEKNSVS
jgi:hypothetical protein